MMGKKILVILPLILSLVIAHPVDNNRIDDEEPQLINIPSGQPEDLDTNPDNYIDLTQFSKNLYGNPDTNSGDALSKWTPDQSVNPEELGSYLEGDILIPSNGSRNGLIVRSSRWSHGIVPYIIEGSFSNDELQIIKRGMDEYYRKTCIRFKPRTSERDYVSIVNDASGCWSSVGRIGGKQKINLQSPGCVTKVGTFIHEAMHALGFLHEQNRYERDDYVHISWENIMPNTRVNFDKASSLLTSAYGVPYDYGSVMHYSAYAFSRNGQPTIIPKYETGEIQMGQRLGMSEYDVSKIQRMYSCEEGDYFEEDDDDDDSEYINFS